MSTFDQIPECLSLEILYRLPPKSVYRFKSVSKWWKNLITEPSFMQSYLAISSSWTLISHFDSVVAYRDIPDEYKGVHFVTPQLSNYPLDTIPRCQGRNYLIASSGDLLLFNGPPSRWNVCSPFTKQWIEVPPQPRHRNSGSWGIRFISRVQDGVAQYKVVIITGTSYAGPPGYESRGTDVFHLATFCSEIGEWRNSKVSLPDCIRLVIPFCRCFSFNGAIHWIEHRLATMIAYNASTNECHLIKMPTYFNRLNGINVVVNVCQGCIRCFEVSTYGLPPQELGSWSLWVLEDYDKGKWRLEHSGDERKVCSLDALPEVHTPQRALTPIAFHPLDLDILLDLPCQKTNAEGTTVDGEKKKSLISKSAFECTIVYDGDSRSLQQHKSASKRITLCKEINLNMLQREHGGSHTPSSDKWKEKT
ncbi:hypothetical protein RJ639_003569 [Escallonia herrerae]|uniref:F-box domain-containing protein n=1 Tax=Escallonia herrerae TaxID=1293975 RepID=A0AA88W385_9ASTE|nr:hypothetical protein RJ639_003569 [Escallonia herrerae]